jgi:hypothetical protein
MPQQDKGEEKDNHQGGAPIGGFGPIDGLVGSFSFKIVVLLTKGGGGLGAESGRGLRAGFAPAPSAD